MKYKALSLFSSAGVAETYFEKHGIDGQTACQQQKAGAKEQKQQLDMNFHDALISHPFSACIRWGSVRSAA